MEADRCRYWQAYVDELRPLMELRDWTIEVSPEPCPENCTARIEPTTHQRHAVLELRANWDKLTPEQQRETLAHELIHCHLYPAGWLIMEGEALYAVMGKPATTILQEAFNQALEYGVEAMAQGWADALPLPGGGDTDREVVAALWPDDDVAPSDVEVEVAERAELEPFVDDPEEGYCGVLFPSGGDRFYCNLRKGHDGPHARHN